MKNKILGLLFTLQAAIALAVDEENINTRFVAELVPAMQQSYQRSYFNGVDDVKINYYFRKIANPKGVIIVSPGQSESSLKYAELLFDLKDSGYNLYIIDHRGQGESGRMLVDGTKAYVKHFEDYIEDFSTFVKQVVKPEQYKRSYILANSMGGAVASGFLVHNPKAVSGVILSAPMLKINPGQFGSLGADLILNVLKLAGRSTDLAPMQKSYDANEKFAGNKLTSSPGRFKMSKDLYNKYPQLRIGGATVNWAKESLEYTTLLRHVPNIYQVPTLLLQAGQDQIVMSSGQQIACAELSGDNCRIVKIKGSQHEILMEKDKIRNDALNLIKTFIQ